jgi:hypothetical protein
MLYLKWGEDLARKMEDGAMVWATPKGPSSISPFSKGRVCLSLQSPGRCTSISSELQDAP